MVIYKIKNKRNIYFYKAQKFFAKNFLSTALGLPIVSFWQTTRLRRLSKNNISFIFNFVNCKTTLCNKKQ